MYAIILTFDRQIEFARLVIASYSKLWPTCPLVFRIPYNEQFPNDLAHRANVELIQTEKEIKATMRNLLRDLEDDEFVFWAIDDRYPVEIQDATAFGSDSGLCLGDAGQL